MIFFVLLFLAQKRHKILLFNNIAFELPNHAFYTCSQPNNIAKRKLNLNIKHKSGMIKLARIAQTTGLADACCRRGCC